MAELMKGKVWSDRKDKVTYPLYAEVKHDEIRCHVRVELLSDREVVQFLSYAGKTLANMQRFSNAFVELALLFSHFEFDCGFEVNGNFNDSYRWVRSTKGVPDDLKNAPLRLYLFDLPGRNEEFTTRMQIRKHYADEARVFGLPMYVPEGVWCATPHDVEAAFLEARLKGYEGLMVKTADHTYQPGKRIDGWLKMKPENDADGEIIAVHRGTSIEGNPLDRVTSITLRLEDGSEATPHGIGHDLGRDMLANPDKYLGQWCEFRYMERDRQGGYRHPVFHRLREAKA